MSASAPVSWTRSPALQDPAASFQPGPMAVAGSLIVGMLGAFILTVALAFVAAWAVDARGLVTRPADHELIGRLVTTVPLLIVVGVAHVIAAVGVVAGRPWARTMARIVAVVGVALAGVLFLGLASGHDPFAAASAVGANVSRSDGLGIVGLGFSLYLAALVLLAPGDR